MHLCLVTETEIAYKSPPKPDGRCMKANRSVSQRPDSKYEASLCLTADMVELLVPLREQYVGSNVANSPLQVVSLHTETVRKPVR